MSAWLVKLVHIAAIAVWIGGLIATPSLLVQRRTARGEAVHRLQRACRFLHVAVVSPAAVVAVGSGIALAFLYETWAEWFSLKLALVGLLAGVHMLTGVGVLRTFEDGGDRVGRALPVALLAGSLGLSGGILWLVLAEPEIDAEDIAGAAFAPGGLERVLAPVLGPVTDALRR